MTLIMSISARRTLHFEKKIVDRILCYHESCATKKCRHGQYFEEDFGMV